MIKDGAKKKDIEEEWDGVRMFQSKIQAHLNASGGMGGVGSTHQLRNISHNLTLLFAFSVLEKTLVQLASEGVFKGSKYDSLKKLMNTSKKSISWVNLPLVHSAREDRNKVAHHKKILERGDCWKYIDAIEAELLSWKVIANPFLFEH